MPYLSVSAWRGNLGISGLRMLLQSDMLHFGRLDPASVVQDKELWKQGECA